MPHLQLSFDTQSNNTALWWPDVPVAFAILIATIVMGIVCVDVHKKVQAFKREHRQGEGESRTLSTKVFWQSKYFQLLDAIMHSTSNDNLIVSFGLFKVSGI
jgi:hypothetical protein